MSSQQIEQILQQWLVQHYPQLEFPNRDTPLGLTRLLNYYEHMEIAMLELHLHDRFPEYLAMLRKRRCYLRRLQQGEFSKEQFRSLSAF